MPSNVSLADVYDSVRKQRQQQQSLAGGVNAPAGVPVVPAPAAAVAPAPPVPNQPPAELQTITPPSLQAFTTVPDVKKSTDPYGVTSYSQVGGGTVTLADVQRSLPNSRGTLSVAGVTPDEMAYRNQVVAGINQATASLRRGRLENRAERTDSIGDAARAELARMDARDQSLGDLQAKQDAARFGMTATLGELQTKQEANRIGLMTALGDLQAKQEANQIKLAAAQAKATPYEVEAQRQQAQQAAKMSAAAQEATQNASDYFEKSKRLREMLGNTGMISSALATMGSPFNSERTAEKERFEALTSGMVLSAIKQLGTNPSNSDLKFVQRAVLDYGKTPEGNRKILDDMDAFMAAKLHAKGVDPSQFLQDNGNATGGASLQSSQINARGEELMQQGLTQDQVLAKLREEFSGAY